MAERLQIGDLSSRKNFAEEISEKMIEKFIGGRGLEAKILLDRATPPTDPLALENKLIFTTVPLQGTRVLFTGRTTFGCSDCPRW